MCSCEVAGKRCMPWRAFGVCSRHVSSERRARVVRRYHTSDGDEKMKRPCPDEVSGLLRCVTCCSKECYCSPETMFRLRPDAWCMKPRSAEAAISR